MDHFITRRANVASLLIMAGLIMLLMVPVAAAAQTSRQVTVTLKEFMITPARITVPQGMTVQFIVTNAGTVQHNLVVENKQQGVEKKLFGTNLMPGETRTAEYTFPTAGDWEMYCPVGDHEEHGMKGDLEVASSAPAGMPSTGGPAFPGTWLLVLLGIAALTGGLSLRRHPNTR